MKLEFKFNEELKCNELVIERWCNYGNSKKLSIFGDFNKVEILEETREFIDCLDSKNNRLVFPGVSSTSPWNYSIDLTKKEVYISWVLMKDKRFVESRIARGKQLGLVVPELKYLDKALIKSESITGIRIKESNEIIDIDYINNTIFSNRISPKMVKEEKSINYCKDIINDIISRIECNYKKLLENNYIQEKLSIDLFGKLLRLEKDPIHNCIIYFDISHEIEQLIRAQQKLSKDSRKHILEYLEKSYKNLLIKNDYKL